MDCGNNPDCKYAAVGCYQDKHHLYWPQDEYRGYIASHFRSFADNTVELCRVEHEELHATQDPPEKPSREFMAGFLLANEHKIGLSMVKRIRKELRQ